MEQENTYLVNQRAQNLFLPEVFQEMQVNADENTRAFLESGNSSMCPVATFATCVNEIMQKRIIGSKEVADVLRLLHTFHNKSHLPDVGGNQYPRWEVFTSKGEIRYQAIATVARGLGLQAEAIQGCPINLLPLLLKEGAKIALSVDNSFIQKFTDSTVAELKPGGHLISVLGVRKDEEDETFVRVADPYADPTVSQPIGKEVLLEDIIPFINAAGVDTWKGILFAPSTVNVDLVHPYRAPNILYAVDVMDATSRHLLNGGSLYEK